MAHGLLTWGVGLIQRHPRLGKKWVFPGLVCAMVGAGIVVSALIRETKFGSLPWLLLLAGGVLAATTVSYFKLCEDRIKELEKGDLSDKIASAQHEAWASIVSQRFNLAGNILSGLMNDVLLSNASPPELRIKLLGLQRDLLRNACEVIVARRQLAPGAITANWVIEVPPRESPHQGERAFVVQCYDQHLPDRQPGMPHPIRPGLPGASQAFLTQQIVFVPDTNAPEVAQHFPGPNKYRAILSVPIVVGSRVIGVVNFDAEETGIILESDGDLVYDIVSLVALCEHLKLPEYAKPVTTP